MTLFKKSFIRNSTAIITGIITGSFVNRYIVSLSTRQLPLDPNDPEYMTQLGGVLAIASRDSSIYLFVGHALGTFFTCARSSINRSKP